MSIPRLRIEDAALLVVDVQERLMPTIADSTRTIANCAVMVRLATVLGIPYLLTEQYPKGLGRTVDEIASVMPDPSRRIEKTRFSAIIELVDEQLRNWSRSSILVCGVEAHVCVLQTVLDLQSTGRQAFVVTDAVSASQPSQIGYAFDRMIGSGAVLSGVLSAMYELLGDSRHPAFEECLPLAKAVL